jgi:YggT family protein
MMLNIRILFLFFAVAAGIRLPLNRGVVLQNSEDGIQRSISYQQPPCAMVLPGDPLITGTVSQGFINAISIYSNVILARAALSWFPQLPRQFPILRPIFTVTEPYLKVFRNTIPPIGGFDISLIPAVFILDIASKTVAAIGAEFPPHLKSQLEAAKAQKKTRTPKKLTI